MSKKRNNNNKNAKKFAFNLLNDKIFEFAKPQSSTTKKINKEHEYIDISKQINDLKKILTEYHPLDIFKTLLIAETWLGNIDEYIKFSLLFNIYFSIKLNDFGDKKVNTYDEFHHVLQKIYKKVPHNPAVEDFSPIADWGEVKYQYKENVYNIFFGSCLTDSYSYIKAFENLYSNNGKALKDLENIIKIQNDLVKKVNNVENIEKKLSIPDENFRKNMLNWIENIDIKNHNKSLIIKNGENLTPNIDFYSKYMNAEVNPHLYFEFENKLYPFSIRNHIPVLIEKYNENKKPDLKNTAKNISLFLNKNLKRILCDNFIIRTDEKVLNLTFSSVFQSRDKVYFVLALDNENLQNINSILRKIKTIMSNFDWGLQKPYSLKKIQPIDNNGNLLTYDKIGIIIILPELTTRNHLVPFTKDNNIEITSLNEFTAVVDCIDSDDEIDEFIEYYKKNQIKTMFMGFNLDGFSSFKNSYGLLEDGATSFSMIMINTHDAPTYRYEKIVKKYNNLPSTLPNADYQWYVEHSYDGNYHLITQNHEVMSWSTILNNTCIHFLFDFNIIDINKSELNLRVLELFSHAAADAFSRRTSYFKNINLPKNITINLFIGSEIKNIDDNFKPNNNDELFIKKDIIMHQDKNLIINTYLNLDYCLYHFRSSTNASFQTEICIKILEIFDQVKKIKNIKYLYHSLAKTSDWPLRMTMGNISPKFDVIDREPPPIKEVYYKKGRQILAQIFKSNNIEPGLYSDVNIAKSIMNDASEKFRAHIHSIIKKHSISSIIQLALHDYSLLVSSNYLDMSKQEMSLKHEVTYNRAQKLAESDTVFKKTSQIYRYLIECTLMLHSTSITPINEEDYLTLLGSINWLLNMYHSSDGLHYNVGVDGIEIDFTYIPEIIISESSLLSQDKYNEELSAYKLGIGLNSADELSSIIPDDNYSLLDSAFYEDLGFGFKNLFTILYLLSNWGNLNSFKIQTFYKLSFDELVEGLSNLITNPDVRVDEIEKILSFLILDNSKINLLEGSDIQQFDVPVGDHSKRTNRLNIKPLISLNNEIVWSPACTHRALGIWTTHTTDGYLPADFDLPTINKLVDDSKTILEKRLENKAFDILYRRTQYIENGIDLKKKFKKENYPDIGDYDVLAFFPEFNCWIMVECKYNQPAYCLKDMSRLRQRIFGKDQNDKSQISKIKRRYDFLYNEHEKIRNSLQWPHSDSSSELKIINLYVSKNTYWWFRCPPYPVELSFVQVGHLDEWLNNNF